MAKNTVTDRPADTPTIDDYAVIGDCRSAALISRGGSVDWLCWPRFDSPSIFAALLDREKGGCWRICPSGEYRSTRRYIDQTNALETSFETQTGYLLLTDFMPIAEETYKRAHMFPDREIIRILTCVTGQVEVQIEFTPRPGYAKHSHRLVDRGKLGLRVEAGVGLISLHSDLKFSIIENSASATIVMKQGDSVPLFLSCSSEAPLVLPILDHADAALKRTTQWWQAWSAKCNYRGPYYKEVLRSLLTLKLLEFSASGAFVAAVTTSLPEKIGDKLNWDYRYCWLRDASLTIQALCETGYVSEAQAFAEWMLHATRLTQPKLMVMYDLYGNVVKREQELKHLTGYLGSRPVHIGNEARKQVQLDTYGEVICGSARVIHEVGYVDKETANVLIGFGKYVCKHWREPDAGIWEPRGKPVVHTHSRLLCWVALHELILLHEKGLLAIPGVESFRKTRDVMRQDIEEKCWKEDFGSYSSEPASEKLDATLLLIAWHNFHEASSPRLIQTYQRVLEELDAGGNLLYRYRLAAEPEEGAFGICSFWAAEFLAMGGGSLPSATDRFEKLLAYANDVGLYAEEVDPETGLALGNFPQAFTHVGLINAALAIQKRSQQQSGASAPMRRVEQVQ